MTCGEELVMPPIWDQPSLQDMDVVEPHAACTAQMCISIEGGGLQNATGRRAAQKISRSNSSRNVI